MGDTLFIQDEGCASLAGSLQQEQPCGAEAADLCLHLLPLLLRQRIADVLGLLHELLVQFQLLTRSESIRTQSHDLPLLAHQARRHSYQPSD